LAPDVTKGPSNTNTSRSGLPPANNVTTFTYELGDLNKVKDPLNRETQRILDAAGQLRNVTNPLGQQTRYTLDALNSNRLHCDQFCDQTRLEWKGKDGKG